MSSNTVNNGKIRLMQITHDLAIGGLQQVIVNLCRSIDQDRFDISVLCLREKGEFAKEVEELGIPVYLIPQKDGADYFSFLKVAEILRKEKIEIIHTHNTQPLFDGAIASLLSGVKTIVHTDHARDFPDKMRYMVAEWMMSHLTYRMVGVSEHTTDNLARYEKISRKKLLTIPNGIDPDKYDIEVDVREKRAELGLEDAEFVIGLGVRLAEQKGITYLLQAMQKILLRYPGTHLIIAGKGDLEEVLRNEAQELDVLSNVHFIGPRLDLNEILKILDIYVLPSLWEGMPMVLLEAMAAKCPIVATNVGGNATVIKHQESGSLVESRNSGQLADEVIRLLGDPYERDKYRVNARKTFDQGFSSKVMAQRYEELYLRQL